MINKYIRIIWIKTKIEKKNYCVTIDKTLILFFFREMKIWLDLRFLKWSKYYESFAHDFARELLKQDTVNEYTFYVSQKLDIGAKNLRGIIFTSKIEDLRNQKKFGKYLEKDEENDLMIFFDENVPMNYNKNFVCIIPTLENLFYTFEKKFFKRYFYQKTLAWSTKHAKKIICFDKATKDELNERINVEDDKMIIIPAFFPFYWLEKKELLPFDIKAKYNIRSEFLIYDAGQWMYKNLDRTLDVFVWLVNEGKDISLVIFWDEPSKDLFLRQVVIDNNLQDRVFFLWEIKKNDEPYFYASTIGFIYPSLYEPFPFYATKAVFYNTPIVSSNIESIQKILTDSVTYCNPLSKSDMEKCVWDFLRKNHRIDYSIVLNNFNVHIFTKNFISQIIQ